MTYAICIKDGGRVIIEHGQAKGQPLSKHYSIFQFGCLPFMYTCVNIYTGKRWLNIQI